MNRDNFAGMNPCRVCGNYTASIHTKLCDRCWELERRIQADPELARRIIASLPGEVATRPSLEIQKAHDILTGVILDHPFLFERDIPTLALSAHVLCWVLLHDHNTAFEKLLASVDKRMEDAGFTLGPEKPD